MFQVAQNGAIRLGTIGFSTKNFQFGWVFDTVQTVQSRTDLLGAAVRRRRRELGLTRDELRARGGPADETVRGIENGRGPDPAIATQTKLESVLGWESGTVARILLGEQPRSGDDIAPSDSLAQGPAGVLLPVSTVTELLAALGQLNELAAKGVGTGGDLEDAMAPVNSAVAEITATLATDYLERNGGPDRQVHPFVLAAYSPYLQADPAEGPACDAEERHYRRWLANMPTDVDTDTRDRFASRLKRARRHNGQAT